ncbi:hypothetical protein PQO01_20790 [Lentisphaera marina]|uniref:hypothetical protein n=1 Tax=Lentisphaera marina TaxID=1111041 RepID=UPI0023668C8F|nr:hypothetical protein [Lentisphaera marina]MDD7985461.1 hypothetical protein [Lentisphaera marina]MDD7987396.1 hypothetical protein [Lentisphaera marina]
MKTYKSHNKNLRIYPSPEDVFLSDIETHKKYLLPCSLLYLPSLDNSLDGYLPIIIPIEPEWGCVGYLTNDYHNYYSRENWIGYKIKNGKCSFIGDFKFFHQSAFENKPSLTEDEHSLLEGAITGHPIILNSYNLQKKRLTQLNFLSKILNKQNNPILFSRELDDNSSLGNWAQVEMPLSESAYIDSHGDRSYKRVPITQSGKEFIYIGTVETNNYVALSDDMYYGTQMLIFYQPEEELMLTTFEYS